MRNIKQIIKDEMDYSLCRIMLDQMRANEIINEDKWCEGCLRLKELFNPPILLMEGVYEKRDS